jgi:phage baseplate assembly protein V
VVALMGLDRDTLGQLGHLMRPLATRIANSVARAVVKLADDAKKLQILQVGALADETIDGAEHHQSYGFSSVPLAGAEAVVVFPNGDRSHPLVIAVSDRRYRPTGGQAGQVTVYNHTGAKVTLTADGDIVLQPATGRSVLAGSSSAVDGAIKGTQRNTAEQTFLTALNAYATAIQAVADPSNAATPVLATAITTFATAAAGAVSTKVKVE